MKLDIGSGRSPLAGYTTVDLYIPADICAPMWNIPMETGSVDEIYCSQALEHVTRDEVKLTLLEWKRLLKPTGIITLKVPDLIWCCQNFIAKPGVGRSLENLYGYQSEPGEVHQTGFTEQILRDYCAEVGLFVHGFDRIFEHEMQVLKLVLTKVELKPSPTDPPQSIPQPPPQKPKRPWRTS